MDFAETIRSIFGGQSSQPPPTGEDYASDLKPMVDAGAEVRRKPRLSFDLYPPKPDHDPVLGEELHDILRSRDKVPSPDFIAPPPGLGQAPNRVPSDMQYERPPNVLSENAARGISAGAVEPFGQAGRLATGGSEDVAGDLAGVGAAVAPVPGAGIGKALGRGTKALEEALAPGTAAFAKRAAQARSEITAAGKGAGPLDLATMAGVPDVPQVPLARYEPPRGISPRLKEALEDKSLIKGIDQSIGQGIEMGADKWYHTEPIRRAFVDELGHEHGMQAFDQYMHMVAATSPRSDASTNVRNASYYFGKMMRGEPLPAKNEPPYGHIAQKLHAGLAQNVIDAYKAHSLGASASPDPWDLMANPKPASFVENLRGNLMPGTMDTHAFRNIGMRSGDPRFLATSLQTPIKGEPGPESMISRYGETGGTKDKPMAIYRPQQLLKQGKITMKELQDIPSFWVAKPNDNEYAAAERLYSDLAAKRGMPTADAQAAAWSGAGKMTGLETPPTHTFPELFNERVLFTAKMRNEDPKTTLSKMIRGEAPLLSIGGLVALHGIDPDEHTKDKQ